MGHQLDTGLAQLQRPEDHEVNGTDRLYCLPKKRLPVAQHESSSRLLYQQSDLFQLEREEVSRIK